MDSLYLTPRANLPLPPLIAHLISFFARRRFSIPPPERIGSVGISTTALVRGPRSDLRAPGGGTCRRTRRRRARHRRISRRTVTLAGRRIGAGAPRRARPDVRPAGARRRGVCTRQRLGHL